MRGERENKETEINTKKENKEGNHHNPPQTEKSSFTDFMDS